MSDSNKNKFTNLLFSQNTESLQATIRICSDKIHCFQTQTNKIKTIIRMNRNFSVPVISKTRSLQYKNQNVEEKLISFKRHDKNGVLKNISLKPKLPSAGHINHKRQNSSCLPQSNTVKKLKNFIKKDQITESYLKQFPHLRKSSFFLNNRLTKSVFDISDAAMIGKPQPLNSFRSMKNYTCQENISSLKNAVKNITKQNKSHIPRLYQRSLSLSGFTKKDELNQSCQRSFFPTTALQRTNTFIDPVSKVKKDNQKSHSISNKLKLNELYKQKLNESSRLTKPLSQRKITKIDDKISKLKQHNQSMHKLIPNPIVKPQKVIIKGKGEIVPQDKIIRIIDKLLSVLQLYFQMHDQNGVRVYAFLKNVEGFQNQKITQLLCEGKSVKVIKSAEQLKSYFWIFRAQQHSQQKTPKNNQFKLPQFFGEEDYTLYKVLNNFVLKLESKYENHHKQKFQKVRQVAVQKQSKAFNNLFSIANQSNESHRENTSQKKEHELSKSPSHEKGNSIISISSNKHTDRKAFLDKIRFNPLNNDKKISSQIQELQDLGVKFDFKQKGKSIILSERSKIIFSKR